MTSWRQAAGPRFLWCLSSAIVAVGAGTAASTQYEVPARVHDERDRVAWVSAAAVSTGGEAALRQLHDPERFDLRWLLVDAANPELLTTPANRPLGDRCFDFSAYRSTRNPAPLGFDSLVRGESQILVGTVVAVDHGLAWGDPQTMIAVHVEQMLGRNGRSPATPLVYLLYESPMIEVVGVRVCRPRDELPPSPPLGARVLAILTSARRAAVNGAPIFDAGHRLVYESDHTGQSTLAMSDRLVHGSGEWILDATVDSLVARIGELREAPDAAGSTPPSGNTRPSVAGPDRSMPVEPRRADPPDDCVASGKCLQTPLVLGFGVFGVMTQDLNSSETLFDIDGNGAPERTAWVLGDSGDAFLWMDLNVNGRVDGAHEFLGAAGTDPRGQGFRADSRLEILALYDQEGHGGNGDGRLDAEDAVWSRLLLWNDKNGNAVSEPSEIAGVEGNVAGFDTRYELTDEWDGSLNKILARGRFWIHGPRRDLRLREILEIELRYR